MILRFAVITAHNRHDMLVDTVKSVAHQVDRIIIVDNASEPPIVVGRELHKNGIIIIRDPEQPPNLSRLWNRGIELAHHSAVYQRATQWDVGVFGDDVLVPQYWYERVSYTMRFHNCVVGATHSIMPLDHEQVMRDDQNRDNIYARMPGWAFMIAGESNLRVDESFRWWWGDTDLDWRARELGGVALAPGPIAVNREPNHWTVNKPELTRQAGQDRMRFIEKWGTIPW